MNKKIIKCILIVFTFLLVTGCGDKKVIEESDKAEIIDYKEALNILKEDTSASVLDIETGITYNVKRVVGGFNTLADVETVTKEDTDKLLKTAGANWNR